MRHNDVSVRVVGGDERDNGYVHMSHGKDYKLVLHNYKWMPCDAAVSIDGKHVGTWRIEANSAITLERPADDHGKFTFYLAGTAEGEAAGLTKGDPNLGLVSVVFTPGQRVYARPLRRVNPWPSYPSWPYYIPQYPTWTPGNTWVTAESSTVTNAPVNMTYTSCNTASATARSLTDVTAGGTGLSGHSNQEYGQADSLQYDYNQQVTINLRLVGIKDGVRPLQASVTPVPPPVA